MKYICITRYHFCFVITECKSFLYPRQSKIKSVSNSITGTYILLLLQVGSRNGIFPLQGPRKISVGKVLGRLHALGYARPPEPQPHRPHPPHPAGQDDHEELSRRGDGLAGHTSPHHARHGALHRVPGRRVVQVCREQGPDGLRVPVLVGAHGRAPGVPQGSHSEEGHVGRGAETDRGE